MSKENDSIKDELKKLKALQAIAHLEGVQLLTAHTKSIILHCVESIVNGYMDKSELELRTLCATLKVNLEHYQLITGLDKQIQAIDEALKEPQS